MEPADSVTVPATTPAPESRKAKSQPNKLVVLSFDGRQLVVGWREIIWTIICVAVVVVFGMRLYVALKSEYERTLLFSLALIGMAWLLFILEGLHVAMTELRSKDSESAKAYIAKLDRVWKKRHARYLLDMAQGDDFHKFVGGREIIVMLLVVGIAQCIAFLPLTHGFSMVLFKESQGLPEAINLVIAVVCAALIPAWFAQLVPQRLAEGCNFEFARLLGGRELASVARWVGEIGADWPSIFGVWLIQFRAFDQPEPIEVGDEKIFLRNSATAAYYVELRELIIKVFKDRCEIVEEFKYCFCGEPTAVVNASVHMFKPRPESLELKTRFGADVRSPADIQLLEVGIANISNPGDAPVRSQVKHIIANAEIELSPALPKWGSLGVARGDASVCYTSHPFNLSDEAERLYADISTLTRMLRVRVEVSAPCFVMSPAADLGHASVFIAESPGMEIPDEPGNGHRRHGFQYNADVWSAEIPFPPVGSRLTIWIDARCDPTPAQPNANSGSASPPPA